MSDFGTRVLKRLLKKLETMPFEKILEYNEIAHERAIQLEKDLELFNKEPFPDTSHDTVRKGKGGTYIGLGNKKKDGSSGRKAVKFNKSPNKSKKKVKNGI